MKTVVNLYVAALQPVQRRFTLGRSVFGLSLMLAVLLLAGLGLQVALQRAQTNLAQVQTELATQREQVQQLTTSLQQRRGDPVLATQLADTQTSITRAERVLTLLDQQSVATSTSYATLLTDIAMIAPGELWLTEIRARDAQLGFAGLTEDAAALPRWMATFDSRPSLRARQFAIFALRENDQGLLQFELQSERMTAPSRTSSAGSAAGAQP